MNALVLDGTRTGETGLEGARTALVQSLEARGYRVDTVALRDLRVAYCQGCFECWTTTPGMCKIADAGRDLVARVVASDLLVFFTPVVFGGYSSELKKAVDRFACPLQLPFFKRVDGEVHHRARYPRLPALLGVGVLPAADAASEREQARVFATLVARNAINLHAPAHASAVVDADPMETPATPAPSRAIDARLAPAIEKVTVTA